MTDPSWLFLPPSASFSSNVTTSARNFSTDIRGNVSSSSRLLFLAEGRSAESQRVKFAISRDAELIAIDRFFRPLGPLGPLFQTWTFNLRVRAWAFCEKMVGGYFLRVSILRETARVSLDQEPPYVDYAFLP